MVALPKAKMTANEYLQWSADQEEGRFELVDGEVVMMSPETVRHVQVKAEVWLALRRAILKAGIKCQAYNDGVGIRIDNETVREPDASIQCKPADPDALILDEPIVVVEVVSPSSVRSDTGAKVAEYFSVASILHYLIVDPIRRSVVAHSRAHADATIQTRILNSGRLDISPPGIGLEVTDLFGDGGLS